MGCCGPPRFEGPFGDKVDEIYKKLDKIDDITDRYDGMINLKDPEQLMIDMLTGEIAAKMDDYQKDMRQIEPLCEELPKNVEELESLFQEEMKINQDKDDLRHKEKVKNDLEKEVPLKIYEYMLRPFGLSPDDNPQDLEGSMGNLGITVPPSLRKLKNSK